MPRPRRLKRLSSPVTPGSRVSAQSCARLDGVIAAEVGGLPDFRDGVVQRLAGLGLQQGDQFSAPRLDKIGRAQKAVSTLIDRRRAPGQRMLFAPAPWRASRAKRARLDRRQRLAMRLDLGQQGGERGAIAEFDAHGILALRREQIARRRRWAWRARPEARRRSSGSASNSSCGYVRLGGAGDEGGVGAVLDQAPHQIGEQLAMRPDRRIDPAGDARTRPQRVVQRLAHAMQPLEFVIRPAPGAGDDGGGGQGVMRGDLRIEMRRGEQAFRRRRANSGRSSPCG